MSAPKFPASMPQLINQLTKLQLAEFLSKNDVPFEEASRVADLRSKIVDYMQELGIDHEFYDFQTNRLLTYGGEPASSNVPDAASMLPPPPSFNLEPSDNTAERFTAWIESFAIFLNAAYPGVSEVRKLPIFLHVIGPDVQAKLKSLVLDESITSDY